MGEQQVVVGGAYVPEHTILPVYVELPVLIGPECGVDGSIRQTCAEHDHRLTPGQEIRGMHPLGRGIEALDAGDAHLFLVTLGQDKIFDLLF